MRKSVGLTQTEYAEKIRKIYPRVLMEPERDRGNPPNPEEGREAVWPAGRIRRREFTNQENTAG